MPSQLDYARIRELVRRSPILGEGYRNDSRDGVEDSEHLRSMLGRFRPILQDAVHEPLHQPKDIGTESLEESLEDSPDDGAELAADIPVIPEQSLPEITLPPLPNGMPISWLGIFPSEEIHSQSRASIASHNSNTLGKPWIASPQHKSRKTRR